MAALSGVRLEPLRPSWPPPRAGRLPDPLAAFSCPDGDASGRKPYIEGGRASRPVGLRHGTALGVMTIDDIIDNFSLLDDWDDRYRYVIELGRGLAPLP